MAMEYSHIVSIVYFIINVAFTIALGFIVYKQGGHKIKSKSYLKDIWNQRKIYAPLIIHFYDTATDIGVLYYWYELKEDSHDYESVDMNIFFWSGVAFLIVYRLCLLGVTIFLWFSAGSGKWYHVLLVLCDLYIFVAVYESFEDAQEIIVENAEKRKEREEKRKGKQEATQARENTETEEDKEKEVEPSGFQIGLQLVETITESMPQIVLQAVFIIRAANDDMLKTESDVTLVVLSTIASLFSISSKFTWVDRDRFVEDARSLKPRAHFPDCVHYNYIMRVLWRMCHVMSRFCVFVLIWTVLGGLWLPIWIGSVYMYWSIIAILGEDDMNCHSILSVLLGSLILIIGVLPTEERSGNSIMMIFKVIESVVAIAVITVFGVLSFHCGVCTDPTERQIFNNDENHRVLIFWILCVSSSVADFVLYFVLICKNIFSDEVD
eukprot:278625_1